MNPSQSPQTVADLIDLDPRAISVLQRHGIDTCCGRRERLEEAATRAGTTPEALVEEVRRAGEVPEGEAAGRAPSGSNGDWSTRPLDEIIDHILERYHRPLEESLPRIEALAVKVHRVHGEKDPPRFQGILDTFLALKAEITDHMYKEEAILFPLIRAGQGRQAAPPIQVMGMEHASANEALERFRRLTDDYTVPPEACRSWRLLWNELATLDADLVEHIRLEEDVLFSRALAGE
jgi:regulator of cell morphogenesis and NO signaling